MMGTTSTRGSFADREMEDLYRVSRERHRAIEEARRCGWWVCYHEAQAELREVAGAGQGRKLW